MPNYRLDEVKESVTAVPAGMNSTRWCGDTPEDRWYFIQRFYTARPGYKLIFSQWHNSCWQILWEITYDQPLRTTSATC